MKKRILISAMSIMMAGASVCSNIYAPVIMDVYARSAPLEEEKDKKDATLGEVKICAVFDKAHDFPVTIDLCPTFSGGVHHYYTLTPEDPTTSDKIAVGNYRAVAYLADEERDYEGSGTRVFAQRTEVSVVESVEGAAPSVVAIVADKGFIDKYAYEITEYRSDDGKALSGIMSESDASGIHREYVAAQNAPGNDGLSDYDSNGIEYDDPENGDSSNKADEPKQEEIPEGEEAVKKDNKSFADYLKVIIPAVAVIGAAAVAVFRKKKRG